METQTETREIFFKNSGTSGNEDRRLRRLFAEYDRLSLFWGRFLTKKLAIPVAAELESVEKTPFSQLTPEKPSPMVLCRALFEPPAVPFYMEFDRALLEAVLDRLEGDDDFTPRQSSKPLTKADTAVAEYFFDCLGEVFAGFCGEEYRLSDLSVRDGYQTAEIDPKSFFFAFNWKIRAVGLDFFLRISLPSVLTALLPQRGERLGPKEEEESNNSEIIVRILAGQVRLSDRQWSEISVGTLLKTDIPADEPFWLTVGNRGLFRVRPGEYRGSAAVEILEPCTPETPSERQTDD